jgi:hypothetical protein
MKYKILIPVTAQVDYFTQCLTKIPDKTKLIVLNNFTNPDIARICGELESQGAEVHNFPWNPGVAPSFNFAMKRLDKYTDDLDYVIVLSPSCLWDRSVEDFVKVIEKQEKIEPQYYYNAPSPQHHSDMHAIAFTKRMYYEFGLWDENLQPYGYDDMDTQRRLGLMGKQTLLIPGLPRTSQNLGGGIGTDPKLFQHFQDNSARQADYYRRKWGGDHTLETFTRPFNNPKLALKDWVLELPYITPIQP